jgi:hypothetical protein
MRWLFAAAITSSILMCGCSIGADRKEPALRVNEALRMPPGPDDVRLQLVTTDVEGCSGADHRVVDVNVEQTEAEVVIEADLKVGNEPFCEIRSVQEDFAVQLDRPLGERLVIDTSRGRRSVIWSPKMRRAVFRRLRVTRSDAEAFLRSEFPGGQDVRCDTFRAIEFLCGLHAPSHEKRVMFYVEVRPGVELKALPERKLSPDLREALKGGRVGATG